MKTSNKFTLVRIISAPIVVILYFFPIWTGCLPVVSTLMIAPVLIFAEITDYLDGHYARKCNEVSDFGKLFDPFADVILHLTTMICCMFTYGSYGPYMYPVIFMLIMIREFSQNFLRMIAAKQGIAIGARKGGKFKTVAYIISNAYALLLELCVRAGWIFPYFEVFRIVAVVFFCLCVLFSYTSFIDYIKNFGNLLKNSD